MAGELVFKLVPDMASVKKAQKVLQKDSKGSSAGGGGAGMGAAVGGFLGGLVGSLIGSLDSIKGMLNIVVNLLNTLIAPFIPILLTLFKPFLSLFLLIGALLLKWLIGQTSKGPQAQGAMAAGGAVGAVAGGAVGGVAGAAIGAGVGTLLSSAAISAGEKLADFTIGIRDKLKSIDDLLGTNFMSTLDNLMNIGYQFFQLMEGLFTLDWEKIKSALGSIGESLIEVFATGFTDMIVGVTSKLSSWIIEKFKSLILSISTFIRTSVNDGIESLKSIGTWIKTEMQNVIGASFEVLKNIGTWIKQKIKGFFSSIGGSLFGGGRSLQDAVITPSGQVYTTSPNDYLIATKNPGAMNGGGSNININITGVVGDDMVKTIAQKLTKELRGYGGY